MMDDTLSQVELAALDIMRRHERRLRFRDAVVDGVIYGLTFDVIIILILWLAHIAGAW